jgi:hypothetical protein
MGHPSLKENGEVYRDADEGRGYRSLEVAAALRPPRRDQGRLRLLPWLAWVLWVVVATLAVLSIVLLVVNQTAE